MNDIFPKTVAYNRFTELESTVVIPFIFFVTRYFSAKGPSLRPSMMNLRT